MKSSGQRLGLLAILASTLLLVGAVGEAVASPISFSATGLASPALTITFDEHVVAPNTSITNQYADLGVTFSPNLFYDPQTGFPNINGHALGNFGNPQPAFVNPFSINFLSPRTAAAFAFSADVTPYTFTALLGGSTVESFDATVGFTSANNFFGFSGITFDELRVTGHPTQVVNSGVGGPYNLLDNLKLGQTANPTPVPEPMSMLLLGTGLVGASVRRRRQQR